MSTVIAYKIFEQTDADGMEGWPSEILVINQADEMDYVEAGYLTSSEAAFEAYKTSLQSAYEAWQAQYHPPAKKVLINDLTANRANPLEVPINVDFVAGLEVKLHRKSTIVKGEIRKEEYFQNFDGTSYSGLVVKEETTFTRNSLGFPLYKDVVVSWALEDGSFHSTTKSWRKFYSQIEQVSEGKYRRGNLIDSLQMPTLGLMAMALNNGVPSNEVVLEGRRFLSEYKHEFSTFIDDSNKEILACLGDPLHPKYVTNTEWTWIDFMTPYGVTIRNYLISEMTI